MENKRSEEAMIVVSHMPKITATMMPIFQDGVASMTLTFQDRGDHHVWQTQLPGGNHRSKDPKRERTALRLNQNAGSCLNTLD